MLTRPAKRSLHFHARDDCEMMGYTCTDLCQGQQVDKHVQVPTYIKTASGNLRFSAFTVHPVVVKRLFMIQPSLSEVAYLHHTLRI